ncbi:L-type lectin-domain containing receptor kinase S.4-like [Aristolochia californica]|uniref:L-type lectin-domain containing receptor kinase S.4-like n=1 Tax=Aristolochia californica TaxID=171875 RepID=UPI0035DA26CE
MCSSYPERGFRGINLVNIFSFLFLFRLASVLYLESSLLPAFSFMAKTLFFCIWAFLLPLTPSLAQKNGFVYSGFDPGTANLTLKDYARIGTNRILRLTNDTSRLKGYAFHPSPIRFKDGSNSNSAFSFSTAFAFAIVPKYPKLGGHGLSFAIVPSIEFRGAHPSQYLGLLNASDNGNFSNHIFAVEFDTVQDFEFGDINDNHVGIDINGMTSNATVSAGDVHLQSGNTIQAWVDYDGQNKVFNVSFAISSTKPTSPNLSFPVDLSPILKDYMYVGFTASTGLLASSHYIMGWNFQMNGKADSLDLSALPALPKPKKKNMGFIIGASTAAAFLLGAAISAAIYLFKKIKNADVIEPWEREYGPHRFSYSELKQATKNFRDKELLGFGGFGRVYKGTLPNTHTQIAVKRVSHESKQGLREFVAEIASIGRLRHRNLVQLQGWCRRRGDLLLVYDYMCNGSLDKFLFDEPKSVLGWEQRMNIIRGVAAGLLYLHEEWDQVVLHRDVKASNVLLDADLNGKLGDFGLARLYEHGTNLHTTHVVGTLGYLAPELTRTGKPTTSTDVFAFGALLLEVACGRRPVEAKALPEELILVDWVWEQWREGRILAAMDHRLDDVFVKEQAELVLKLGLLCSHPVAGERPRMRDAVRYMDGEAVLPEVPVMPPSEYNRTVGFDDFVDSYPSSSEKEGGPLFSFETEATSTADLLCAPPGTIWPNTSR